MKKFSENAFILKRTKYKRLFGLIAVLFFVNFLARCEFIFNKDDQTDCNNYDRLHISFNGIVQNNFADYPGTVDMYQTISKIAYGHSSKDPVPGSEQFFDDFVEPLIGLYPKGTNFKTQMMEFI
jgi:hypothetical protein